MFSRWVQSMVTLLREAGAGSRKSIPADEDALVRRRGAAPNDSQHNPSKTPS